MGTFLSGPNYKLAKPYYIYIPNGSQTSLEYNFPQLTPLDQTSSLTTEIYHLTSMKDAKVSGTRCLYKHKCAKVE